MAKKKMKKSKITKGEKLLYFVIIFAFVFSLGIKTFCGAMVSELKMSIEEIDYLINHSSGMMKWMFSNLKQKKVLNTSGIKRNLTK